MYTLGDTPKLEVSDAMFSLAPQSEHHLHPYPLPTGNRSKRQKHRTSNYSNQRYRCESPATSRSRGRGSSNTAAAARSRASGGCRCGIALGDRARVCDIEKVARHDLVLEIGGRQDREGIEAPDRRSGVPDRGDILGVRVAGVDQDLGVPMA